MLEQPIDFLISALQASLSAVAVISGVGLIVLSITNRYSTVTSRIRGLLKDFSNTIHPDEKNLIIEEVNLLRERATIMRSAVIFAVVSILFSVITVFALFSSYIFSFSWHLITIAFFFLSLISLMISLAYFIKDLLLSLDAINIDIERCITEE